MTSHEKLMAEYEDALFAVLMQQAMEAEGAALRKENERLAHAMTPPIPADTDARMLAAMDAAFGELERECGWKGRGKPLRVLLIAALVSALLMSAVYASVPAVQEKVDALIAHTTGTILSFDAQDELFPVGEGYQVICGYCYEEPLECRVDFALETVHYDEAIVQYKPLSGGEVYYYFAVHNADALNIGIGDAEVEELRIGGYDALVVDYQNREYLSVYLLDHKRNKVVEISGWGVERSVLESIASDIRFVGGRELLPMRDRMLGYAVPSLTDSFALEEKTDAANRAYRSYSDGQRRFELSVFYDIGDALYALEADEVLVEQVQLNGLEGMIYRKDGKVQVLLADPYGYTAIHAAAENMAGYEVWDILAQVHREWDGDFSDSVEYPTGEDVSVLYRVPQLDPLWVTSGGNGWNDHKWQYSGEDRRVVFSAVRTKTDLFSVFGATDGEAVRVNGWDGYRLPRPYGSYVILYDAAHEVYLSVLCLGTQADRAMEYAAQIEYIGA